MTDWRPVRCVPMSALAGRPMHLDRDLEVLVRWLALPYGENRPLFATADWQGKPLDDGKRLAETYLSVVGEKSEPARVGMAWTRCPTCGTFQTIPVEP